MRKQESKKLTKEQVREFLPDAIKTAFESYRAFMQQDVSAAPPKEFSDHHGACKAAIAHVNLLIKLAEWAELDMERIGVDPAALGKAMKEYSDFQSSG